jgi:hypothetical protein
VELKRYKIWLDRALSLITVVAVLMATYLLATERVIPALRGAPAVVSEGEKLPGFLTFERLQEGDRSGVRGVIRVPGERATLLLLFDSTCAACYANLPAWNRVVRGTYGVATVLAVALEGDGPAARAYVKRHIPSALPVVPEDAQQVAGRLGIGIVPSTALVGADGVLRYVRQGSLDPAAVDSLLRALEALRGLSL